MMGGLLLIETEVKAGSIRVQLRYLFARFVLASFARAKLGVRGSDGAGPPAKR